MVRYTIRVDSDKKHATVFRGPDAVVGSLAKTRLRLPDGKWRTVWSARYGDGTTVNERGRPVCQSRTLPLYAWRDPVNWIEFEPSSRADEQPQRTAEDALSNLLAVIHRDGGQHQGAVGLHQAVLDAHYVVPDLFRKLAELAVEVYDLRATRSVRPEVVIISDEETSVG